MQRRERLTLLKNAIANVARGSATALVAIALPPFLTRLMSSDAYGAWSLVLQLGAYVGYLDFGIQTAVGRFIALTGETGDSDQRDRVSSTAIAALTVAGAVGLMGSVGLAALLPHIFHQVPISILFDSRWALILVGGSLALGLPCSVFNGIFVGIQRYEIPAVVVGSSRLFSAICLVVAVRHGGNLTAMGAVVAAVNLASYGWQYLLYRHLGPPVHFSSRLVSWKTGRELFDYCLSLSIWSFAMLLISGLDVALVGYFEFEKVAYYSVAATFIVFLGGLQNALFNALIPSAAVMHARGDSVQLAKLMITATRYGSLALLIVGLPLIAAARPILTLWIGPKYAAEGARILQILAAANMVRLSAVPYVMTLIGTGQQRLVTITPALEGVSNLIASLAGGLLWGAIGVAIGTLIGGCIGVLGNFFYNMPRTIGIRFRIVDYVRDGLLRPLVCAFPFIVATSGLRIVKNLVPDYVLLGGAIFATAYLLWRYGLIDSERGRLFARLVPQG